MTMQQLNGYADALIDGTTARIAAALDRGNPQRYLAQRELALALEYGARYVGLLDCARQVQLLAALQAMADAVMEGTPIAYIHSSYEKLYGEREYQTLYHVVRALAAWIEVSGDEVARAYVVRWAWPAIRRDGMVEHANDNRGVTGGSANAMAQFVQVVALVDGLNHAAVDEYARWLVGRTVADILAQQRGVP